jgi:hypothetical protein
MGGVPDKDGYIGIPTYFNHAKRQDQEQGQYDGELNQGLPRLRTRHSSSRRS